MNLARIEDTLLVLSEPIGVPVYDFDFDLHFACRHPFRIDGEETCVLRIGAVPDYAAAYAEQLAMGLPLVNSPDEHARASELEHWYPLIDDLTPRTQVFERLPPVHELEAAFEWPVFIKGSRQTSKHNPALSVVEGREHYAQVLAHYRNDPILHWQKPVVREFVPLAPVAGQVPGKVGPSLEFRSFWWHGQCVGWGRYWYQVAPYETDDAEAGLAVARTAAHRLRVPFLVIDFAKTRDGRWLVIECNDAQEAGYVAIPPRDLWRRVLERVPAK